MNIIIPMAGMGKRMRPHTLTTPKPMLPVAGKPIVQRLVEDIAKVVDEPIDEIAFVIGNFGKKTEQGLLQIAESVGAKGSIHYQLEALGTAHAILCAGEALTGKVVVAYADTLFKADFKLDSTKDGIIWVNRVNNPEQFGVVKLQGDGSIEGFYEKPEKFVSDLAIIGIYYFKDGGYLKEQLQYLLDQKITTGGEYGITDGLQNMMKQGTAFHTETVTEWLDCGNKDATVETNRRVLELVQDKETLLHPNSDIDDAIIIEPCFIAESVQLRNVVIGPWVSVGKNTVISNSIIKNSIIQNDTLIENQIIENSMIGNDVSLRAKAKSFSLGDFNQLEE
ncbi:MAG: NTP transferase domain-containing protein [Bacteroidetes bacterium]|nr:NTP transferase domain-containing protein [Bacteroidota bacterium]MBU1579056.1 NTP transferase domain-containing protein [Bacteroidota bacterium]MBU2465982.1 NTP transferase domain-containing protein [Bacteroidota bacterium]MBU2557366.1 NTP transferase domain-containing protein [Bacteroidota bacterium]